MRVVKVSVGVCALPVGDYRHFLEFEAQTTQDLLVKIVFWFSVVDDNPLPG